MTEKQKNLVCSFCNKTQNEVRKLIAGRTLSFEGSDQGQTVFICDECVDLCAKIIAEENNEQTTSPETEQEFKLTSPHEIKKFLDTYEEKIAVSCTVEKIMVFCYHGTFHLRVFI